MTSKVINLDNDAEELYAQLDGVEIRKLKKATFSGSDRLAQSLQAEQRHYDALRSLIASLAYHVGACLTYPSGPGKEQLEKSTFAQLEKIFGILKQNPRIGNTALIR
ncbi:MAG: hypothetical protein PVF14_19160, partial [Desulfobacterales bacterium]